MEPHFPNARIPQLHLVNALDRNASPSVIVEPQSVSVTYLESLGLSKKNPARTKSSLPIESTDSSRHELLPLHACLDTTDEKGELTRSLLQEWSLHAIENDFASTPLYCEVKLKEARQMTERLTHPNRFFITICFQLWEKWVQKTAEERPSMSLTFLNQLRSELAEAVFIPSTHKHDMFHHRVPYFVEYRRLCRHSHQLLRDIERREQQILTKQKLPFLVQRVFASKESRQTQSELRVVFRSWMQTIKKEKECNSLKDRLIRAFQGRSVRELFLAWRIETMKQTHQQFILEREASTLKHNAMLSRKEAQISEQKATIATMTKMIDSLKETNVQLKRQIEQTESMSHVPRIEYNLDFLQPFRQRALGFEQVEHEESFDSIPEKNLVEVTDDESLSRINRMLMEMLFAMARTVESCAIQMTKDTIESLEAQYDGSALQDLAEAVHTSRTEKQSHESSRQKSIQADKHVSIRQLAHLPVDEILLDWFQMHLTASPYTEKASDSLIQNFTSDLCDGRRYSLLLHQLFPTWFDAKEIDTEERLKLITQFQCSIQPPLPPIVTSDSIHGANLTENIAFIGILFGVTMLVLSFCMLAAGNNDMNRSSSRYLDLEKQRSTLLDIVGSWQRVRRLMLSVKKANLESDSLTVFNLLQEIRNYEAQSKQLHIELCALAVASNEAASTLCILAHRMQGLTWSCLHARAIHQMDSIAIVDLKWQQQLSSFTKIDTLLIREMMCGSKDGIRVKTQSTTVNGRRGKTLESVTVTDKDVTNQIAELQNTLKLHARDLADIFQHYSASTEPNGSITTLSLQEYNKFLQDCKIHDANLPISMTDSIYRAVLLHGSSGSIVKGNQTGAQRELREDEFVEVLIRLAGLKYPQTLTLGLRLCNLIEKLVLPNALRSQSVKFRAEICSPNLLAVFQKHKVALQRVFRYYVVMHHLREDKSSMGFDEFSIFARDCRVVAAYVSEQVLKQIFINAQHKETEENTSTKFREESTLCLNFEQFKEAIGAMSVYVLCSPYIPLFQRLERFISDFVLLRAKQRQH
uniref:Uncharacterized protein AlNc14C98G5949 n=1 Tax=Albugo laibachii Nc14 TaxID=890382 RepID=F0WH84_9STRA|nr:conserved hypothetical protein [Albugo laibachii Nc14]|eukprot:CCA20599.1 conserved hypothetical protein [Albugo laibachii Nc14]